VELVDFLGNWVVTHVLDHDQAYFAHLRSIGAIG
jgi:hemerythrin